MKRVLLGGLIAGVLATAGCHPQSGSIAGVLATGQESVSSIAVDDFFVYWTVPSGAINKVPISGGPVQLVVAGQLGADNLAVDQTHLVWSAGGLISALAKDTGTLTSFVPHGEVRRLSIDPTSVYWTVDTGSVNKAPKTGESLTALAENQPNPLPITAGTATIFWANAVAAADPTDPSPATSGAVMVVPAAGGAAVSVLPMQDNPVSVVTDSANVYWANLGDSTNGTVNMAALDGSNPQVLATGESNLWAVASDAVGVYFSSTDGRVSAVSVTGGDAAPLINGPSGRVSLAMDATNIYWANATDGAILTMPKLY